ncbi:MAG: GDP-L-fucose synthase [Candidatus Nanoarchaeia archaeon]|nr:GDP-L-fucose synthase [Candidatus Nanoarchaeia archaeon]
MEKKDKILVLGGTGLVGSNLLNELRKQGYTNLLSPRHHQLDLLNFDEVVDYFYYNQIDNVFLCAARVGGINANDKYSADFIMENTIIQTNVIRVSHRFKVKKLLMLGSSCIYPKECSIPIKEEYLLTGPLEKTNLAYAMAKLNGIVMCQMFRKQYKDNFICVMPTNLHGKCDSYDLETSHVFPALIRKIHEAKINHSESITLWGTGEPKREFLFVEDLAEALIFLMNNYNESEIINVGTGEEISILELTKLMCEIIGYDGKIIFDSSKPNGTMRKVMDVSKINKLGWKAKTTLQEGIKKTYKYFLEEFYN